MDIWSNSMYNKLVLTWTYKKTTDTYHNYFGQAKSYKQSDKQRMQIVRATYGNTEI